MNQDFSDNSLTTEAEVFVFPASFAQTRLWFLDRLFPGNSFYNVAIALCLSGSLNISALEETFKEIVRRHEALRTNFRLLEGQLVQVIAPVETFRENVSTMPVVDLRHLSIAAQEAETQRIVIEERSRFFDLAIDPLLRVMLLQRSSDHVLLLNLHHIICDGWSMGVLIGEIGAIYTAFSNNKSSPLPPLPIQYADYTHWQREWLQNVGATHESPLQTQLNYWKQQLNNISLLNLPSDRSRPTTPTYQGKAQYLELPKCLIQELETLSQRNGVTLFMILLAAFQTLLYRYTEQEDIAIGSPIANRNRREIEPIIGFFVNSLVLRTNLTGNPTFLELLGRVREVTLGAYAHQDLPFEKLVEELHPERSLSHHPLFQVVFSLQNTPIQALELPGLTLSQLNFDNPNTQFDLEFQLWESSDGLRGQIIYSCDLFNDSTITRMLGHFQNLLESIVNNPQQRICQLQLLTENEQKLLTEWNNTQTYYPKNSCIHQLFEAQVEQTPHAVAVVFEDEQLTYRELNNRANQLAYYLQKIGVGVEVIVGICLERSIEMLVGILGILKAGGAYVPLDPNYPSERLNFMLEDSQVSVLLTHSSVSIEHLTLSNTVVISLDKNRKIINQGSQENPNSNVRSDNLAYLIYTSGSTGTPKGVLVQHQGLCNLSQAQVQTFNLKQNNRILQFASLSFDASIFEIVMALLTGAILYLAKKESLLPGRNLIQFLQENAITNITLPPSALAVLPTAELPALQTIIAAGEVCSSNIIKPWALSGRQIFNAYGPTEATVWATISRISNYKEKPSIGRPISNTQTYILNSHLQPVPVGIPGELYIGGDGLARGYLNRPELTAEKFIPNPFSNKISDRIYKTGDLATFKPDGTIEFIGRIDEQVKIRGFRIELGEVEAALNQHPAVRQAVVIVREDVPSNKQLVAYVVQNPEQLLTAEAEYTIPLLRQFLREKLPKYMMPSAFVVLESLPLTHTGKVDRRALPICVSEAEPLAHRFNLEKVFVAPRTSTQSILVEIWAELLNLERVGIHDNFFDLGGDSLLAVRLMSQIYDRFERELPLSLLFLNPTVEALANTLDSATNPLPWSPLVAIQAIGSKPPFFCIHPIFGVVFPYYELAHHLGSNQPFYGLQPLGIDGEHPPLKRIEDMAAYYIKALRTVQPEGPYCIGGWSFGGLVAFEMAQQLTASGQKVALLAVLDTLAPASINKPSLWDACQFIFTTVGRYIWPFLLDYLYLLMPVALMPLESKRRILRELSLRPMFPVFQANSKATLDYVPQVYQGRITLLKSKTNVKNSDEDLTMGWSQLTSEKVDLHLVPGNHLSMLKKPHVQVLGEQLRRCLAQI